MSNQYKSRFQITGSIVKIGEVQTFASGFQKREIIVNTNNTRPSPVALALFKDDVSKADSLKDGEEVSVEGTINGREWQGPNGTRYFNDMIIKSIIRCGDGKAVEAKSTMPPAPADDAEMPF